MKKENLTPKNADEINAIKRANAAKKVQANPLSANVVKEDKSKKSESPAPSDPEKEKKIADAQKMVTDLTNAFADAKTKLADAKKELRTLTGGKKDKSEKGPGVISTILTLVQSAPKSGISKDEILKKLIELFPDRASEGMEKTINVQLPGRMSKERGIKIEKSEAGGFFVAK